MKIIYILLGINYFDDTMGIYNFISRVTIEY